jgi:hypothetical protein
MDMDMDTDMDTAVDMDIDPVLLKTSFKDSHGGYQMSIKFTPISDIMSDSALFSLISEVLIPCTEGCSDFLNCRSFMRFFYRD